MSRGKCFNFQTFWDVSMKESISNPQAGGLTNFDRTWSEHALKIKAKSNKGLGITE